MIQIKLDKGIKKKIKGLHWLWFWKRLNDKELHLRNRTLTAFQFLHEQLGWEKRDFYEVILGEYSKLTEYIKSTDRFYSEFKTFFDDSPSTYIVLKHHLGTDIYGPEEYEKKQKI